ncbi:unnamed protein product [Calicophoron daubneyi]|uniref:Nucleoporin Nup54 alpha-helical domain-containing protein n=1 Tax=Calicophoron daubneyi TaxID=300641 RepID=A0AAV2T8P7_CALDB
MSLFGIQKPFGAQTPGFGAASNSPVQTGFGASTTSSSFGGFGFGTTTTAQSGLLHSPFSTQTTNLFGGLSGGTTSFGTNATKTTSSLFPSTLSTPATQSLGAFGSQPSVGFGSSFGHPQSTTSSLFSFSAATNTSLGGPTQAQQMAQQNSIDAFFASLCQPLMFGDERDTILARWDQLQAMWGTGMGYSSLGIANYTPQNTFARFKSIAYNLLPTSTDADGLVCLYLSRPFSEVFSQRQGLQDYLFRLLGGRPNLQLVIEEVRPCTEEENHSEVILKVIERQPTGNITNVPASELAKYLSGPTVASQLQSQLCVYKLTSEVCPSSAQLTAYNENPPAGIDRLIWEQARTENPHPDRLIPVPLVGFADLKRRRLDQVAFSRQQSSILKNVGELVQEMKTGQLAISQKVAQLKRKQVELSHRVLQVLRRQEIHRRAGFAISADEEALRCGLERIWAELTSPRGLRIRFQDALASFRAMGEDVTGSNKENNDKPGSAGAAIRIDGTVESHNNWNLDEDSWSELKEYLSQRQNGIRELQHLLSEMSASLKVMEENPASSTVNTKSPFLFHPRPTPNKVSFALNTHNR